MSRSRLVSALEHNFRQHSSAPAVEGERVHWTYAELDRHSAALIDLLKQSGVGPGDTIGILLPRSVEHVLTQVATVRMGASYCAIDPTTTPALISAALQALAPRSVVANAGTRAALSAFDGNVISIESLLLALHKQNVVAQNNDAMCSHSIFETTLAYTTFTSGTTGTPKGVMIPHSGIARLVLDTEYASFAPGDRWGFISDPSFDASTLDVWAPLLNGGCCVVQETASPSLEGLAQFIRERRVENLFLTSSLFSAMVEFELDTIGALKQLLVGGERVSRAHARRVIQHFPHVRLIHAYGPTENTTFTTARTLSIADTDISGGLPLGEPIRGTQIRIGLDDTEQMRGELLTAGDGLALGYLNDDGLTAAKFVELAGTRWYRTGDLVTRQNDGALLFDGRVDRQVKVQGHRIELDAVELALSTIAGIHQAAVLVMGESVATRHLVAVYTAAFDVTIHAADLQASLRELLPQYAIPHVMRRVDDMPRKQNGKVDEIALQQLLTAHATDDDAFVFATETERRLAQFWATLFPQATIGPLSNFHELGGTSLQLLRLSALVRRELHKDFTPIDALRIPLFRDQVLHIDHATAYVPPTVRSSNSRHELTRIQRGVLNAESLDPSRSAFLVHVALRFPHAINSHKLRLAFEQLAQRHPALRLDIASGSDVSHAAVGKTLRSGWWQDFGVLNIESIADDLPDEVVAIVNRSLEINHAGVMRVDSWHAQDNSALVVWTIHHVSIDEASVDQCLDDLNALLNGTELLPTHADPLELATFERLHTDTRALDYWPSKLAGTLGASPPAIIRHGVGGTEVSVNVSELVGRVFLNWCASMKTTPFAPAMVAYARAVQQVFGREHAFLAVPFSRRSDPAVHDAVGCLIDLSVVEAGARIDESLSEQLVRMRGVVADRQQLTFFPFDEIARLADGLAPGSSQHMSTFAFTWRTAPARTLPMGHQQASLLRTRQITTRFGMTMHVWLQNGALRCSIETIDMPATLAQARSVGEEFVRNLELLSAISKLPDDVSRRDEPHPSSTRLVSYSQLEVLRTAWSRNTSARQESVQSDSNFWEHGGTSITALQMVAQLSRSARLQISPSAFFSNPTFGNLLHLAEEPNLASDKTHVLIGAPRAPRLIVMLPGDNGFAVSLFRTATHLQRLLGDDFAVAVIESQEMLRHNREASLVTSARARTSRLLDQLGRDRIAAIAGFSSGGLTALSLAQSTADSHEIPVWLLDTYAPFRGLSKFVRTRSRPAIRKLLESPIVATVAHTPVRMPHPAPATDVNSIDFLRQLARKELEILPVAAPTGHAHLIQATHTAREQLVLRNHRRNGFAPEYFKFGSVIRLSGRHDDITTRLAEDVAACMADSILKRERAIAMRRSQSEANASVASPTNP